MIRFAIKLFISVSIIIFCTQIGRRFPTLAGLIAVMPLTGLIVLLWLYSDNPNNSALMINYTKGAVWGIIPTILFFLVAFICFHKHLPLWIVLCASFAIWIGAAFVHQWLLR
jgi:F0F1-type ATP synthase assembly protein I